MCKAEEICEKPFVVIQCLTYNHQPYIRQCLDGFIMQKTDFPFIAVIHDDASTDGTAEVVKEYEKKYPAIIKGIYQKENQYKTNPQAIDNSIRPLLTGKYIAVCEGDDYWTDPLKLQKQVDFLENHLEYSMCFHGAEVKIEHNKLTSSRKLYKHLQTREYSGFEILKQWSIPTASVMFRNSYGTLPQNKHFLFGDIVLFLWLAENGKIFCMKDIMAVYRRNGGSVSLKKIPYRKFIDHYIAINECFNFKYNNIINKLIGNVYISGFLSGKMKRQSYEVLYELMCHPKYIFYFIIHLPIAICKYLFYKIAK